LNPGRASEQPDGGSPRARRALVRIGAAVQALLVLCVVLAAYPSHLAGDRRYVAAGAIMVLVVLLAAAPLNDRLRQLALIATLLIGLNTIVTPFLHDRAPTLTPNYLERVQFVGDVMPGFSGVQTISTDAKGYRTNVPVDYARKPAGVFRVFAIGGSTTEQIALGDEKTWVSVLAEHLERSSGRRVEAVNTGVSGMRAEHHLVTLATIAGYEPDLVIVTMGVNDWNRHIKTGGNRAFLFFYDLVEHLDMRQSVMGRAYRALHSLFAVPHADRRLPALRIDRGEYLSRQNNSLERSERRKFYPEAVSPNYRGYAREIASFCRSHALRCMFVDQPTAYAPDISAEVKTRLWMTPPNEDYTLSLENMAYIAQLYNSSLRAIADESQLAFCGISGRAAPTSAVFYDDCHFNEPGARRVAAMLADCVLTHKLGP
jgi:lysophospholipase L1-like esterase